ncbi:hypothetical protein ACIS_00760 [Anaplasma centrale str. Israel]|uniref:Uncharacterized protein n=1 Tax=Anaplasma centrale (strain Israel) TaxID=574556 RepID=D1AS61_ANACI|nr:hypothetical protein [Anaplasma centrale]ACZ49314.1 hypothetical protein ACIS_00760 [Anaplasma centrale str. Israel]
MKNLTQAILSIFTVALLLAVCAVAGAVAVVLAPICFLCALAIYGFNLSADRVRRAMYNTENALGLPHNKKVMFGVEQDGADGIKLCDIANGQCSEYKGTALRDVLQHATYDAEKEEYFFPSEDPALLVSGSGQHFFGYGRAVYPVQPPASRPAYLFPPQRTCLRFDSAVMQHMGYRADPGSIRELVLGTNFVVTGPRSNDVKLQSNVGGSGISRVRIIAPVVLSKTRDMNPTRVALLSPYVVQRNQKSVFLRRYTALARAGVHKSGKLSEVFSWDMHANTQQFAHILKHNRGALSESDAEFLYNSTEPVLRDQAPECDAAALKRHAGDMSLLLGLSQSNGAMFKPLTKQGTLWLTSEFIHSRQFQDAVISASMASMKDAVDQGTVSREAIMESMPYLCKQIPGLCEAVYAIVRAAHYNNAVCEENQLGDIALHDVARALSKHGVQLPGVDAESAPEGMSDAEVLRLDELRGDALRASSTPLSNVRSMHSMGRRVLRDSYCSDIIACLVARRVSSLWDSCGRPASDLCKVSDEFVINYMTTHSVLRNHACAHGAELELADRQECDISCDVYDISMYEFRKPVRRTPASDTSLDAPQVTEVGTERRDAGLSPGAASA